MNLLVIVAVIVLTVAAAVAFFTDGLWLYGLVSGLLAILAASNLYAEWKK